MTIKIGQLLGLPTTMSYIAIVSILVTSAATLVYHRTIWNPVQLTANFSNGVVVVIGLIMVVFGSYVSKCGCERG